MRALILPALLLIALPTFAATPPTFEEVDADGDGLISADEAANVEGLDFNAADSDNDGTLSVDEYEIAVEKLSSPVETTASTSAAKPTTSTTPVPPSADAAKPIAPTAPTPPAAKVEAAPVESTPPVKPAAPPTPRKP